MIAPVTEPVLRVILTECDDEEITIPYKDSIYIFTYSVHRIPDGPDEDEEESAPEIPKQKTPRLEKVGVETDPNDENSKTYVYRKRTVVQNDEGESTEKTQIIRRKYTKHEHQPTERDKATEEVIKALKSENKDQKLSLLKLFGLYKAKMAELYPTLQAFSYPYFSKRYNP